MSTTAWEGTASASRTKGQSQIPLPQDPSVWTETPLYPIYTCSFSDLHSGPAAASPAATPGTSSFCPHLLLRENLAQCPTSLVFHSPSASALAPLTLSAQLLDFGFRAHCEIAERLSQGPQLRLQLRIWAGEGVDRQNERTVSTITAAGIPPPPFPPTPHIAPFPARPRGHLLWDPITQTTTSSRRLRPRESRRRRGPEQRR